MVFPREHYALRPRAESSLRGCTDICRRGVLFSLGAAGNVNVDAQGRSEQLLPVSSIARFGFMRNVLRGEAIGKDLL